VEGEAYGASLGTRWRGGQRAVPYIWWSMSSLALCSIGDIPGRKSDSYCGLYTAQLDRNHGPLDNGSFLFAGTRCCVPAGQEDRPRLELSPDTHSYPQFSASYPQNQRVSPSGCDAQKNIRDGPFTSLMYRRTGSFERSSASRYIAAPGWP
jgi:hypothetical protein